MIDKSTGIPVYKQIGASIRTDIDRGVYPRGSKLPSEADIAERLGVSRGTVRQALSDLSNQGIVKRIHGSGTFVCESGNECKIETDHFNSFLDNLEHVGVPIDTIVMDRHMTIPEGSLSEVFSGNVKLYAIKRLRKRDGKCVMFSIDHIPFDLAPDIDRKYKDNISVYDFLEKTYALRICKVKRIFYAIAASREVAQVLSLKEGEPIFYIIQQAFEEYGRCIDYAYLYIVSEAMHFSVMTSR